ncbi:hypothetical protein BHE74_00015262 [Ensete ventricosum]|nr:hypothetical protein BHE74_00015262 [Ensete ventricosum]
MWECSRAYIRLKESGKSNDKAEQANVTTKKAKENRMGARPVTRWQRSCMGVTVCLSIDQGELLGEHRGIEAGGRKGRGSDNELLIKIAESGELQVDARVPDQGTKYAVHGVVHFLLRAGDKDNGEDDTIPEATKTIRDLLQVGVKFCSFRAKLLAFRKFDGNEKVYRSS